MIVVDIGNTNIVIGIYFKQKIKKIIRFSTKDKKLKQKLNKNIDFRKNSILKLDYRYVILSSMEPFSEKILINFFKSLKIVILNINLKNVSKSIKFNYMSSQLGADRIANTFAALKKYGKNSLVIDFGTATTFDLTVNGIYEGGLISPGINTSHNALINDASKLNKIKIAKTKKIISNNTKDSMKSGFYWGYISLINGIIKKIILDKKIKPKIILTGGLADIFRSEIKFKTYYEPNLTLEGLYLIGKKKYA